MREDDQQHRQKTLNGGEQRIYSSTPEQRPHDSSAVAPRDPTVSCHTNGQVMGDGRVIEVRGFNPSSLNSSLNARLTGSPTTMDRTLIAEAVLPHHLGNPRARSKLAQNLGSLGQDGR
jgi:hypothetical protein